MQELSKATKMLSLEEAIEKFSGEESFCLRKDFCPLLRQVLRKERELKAENEKLTEIFEFATLEFEKRNRKIAFLEEELKKRDTTIKEKRCENELLKRRLLELEARNNLLNKMVFGKKSEKKEGEKFPDVESKRRGATRGHTGYGRKIPENLEEREEIIDLPEEKKFCSHCGKPYIEIGLEEVSSEVCIEKRYYLKRIKRKVYKKTCNCQGPIVTTPAPPKIIPKGKFSIDFWVDVLINKFRNHLPVERQVLEMKEYGLDVPTGTIFGGLKKIDSLYLEPLYEAMGRNLREAHHWYADESGWHLFVKINDKENYNWLMWVFISKDIVFFVLHPTRSAKVPCKTLFDIEPEEIKMIEGPLISPKEKKIMNVDKFSSYKMLKGLGLVELAFCWAHQRREFIDLKTKYSELSSWAEEWIERIGNLYYINNERIKYTPEDSLFREYDQKLREKLNEIYSLINREYNHPAQTAVMNSMKEHWKGLTLFVNNPEIAMDNNLAERMLRPMVLGRKNYWGNHSLWAGKLTAAMFSIIQTCLMHEISPRAYLTYYLTECAKRGSTPSEDEIEAFLPPKLNESIKTKLKSFG
ncbi:MAG: IS66 family transposase [bacterium]